MLLWTGLSAHADELKDISQLIGQGQFVQALDRANGYLSSHPKDVQGQFLKGVILAEQNKSAEAIKIFTDITEKHPELPEPYNNLAVLYADQNQYDKARRALEMAIKTHPSYATAHENLGDIYAKMATDAYDKALQLDKGNARTQTKLAMIKDLFSTSTGTKMATTKPEEQGKPAAALPMPAAAAPVTAQGPEASKQAKPAMPATLPATAQKGTEKTVEKPATLPKEEPKKDEASQENSKEAALEAVHNWAKAWSAQNVENYLASYADSFKTPNGESRSEWEQSRKDRIRKPDSIKVEVLDPKISIANNRADVTFRQVYRAGDNTKRTVKTLILKKAGGKWLIDQEKTNR